MKVKACIGVGIIGALLLVGCMTEQERIAYEQAKRENAARELANRIKAYKSVIEDAYKQRVEKYWSDIAEHNYNFIQAKYAVGDKVLNRFRNNNSTPDCLGVWVEPRLGLTQDEKEKGRAMLEGFAARYLPNAYSNYDKAKENAEEIQQMFNENFPEPWTIESKHPGWSSYCNLLKALCKARAKYFRAHDELAHFYIMYKVGAATGEDLEKLDQEKINILLLEENGYDVVFPTLKYEELDSKTCDFATKYMPNAYACYAKLKNDRDESLRLYTETLQEGRLIDAVRFNLATIALCEKINYLTLTMHKLGLDIKALYLDHKTMDKDAETIAKADHSIAMHWKPFMDLLPKYVYDRANGPLIPVNSSMNAFYSNKEILLWHWYALGFPVLGRNEGKLGWLKHFRLYGNIEVGDVIDTLSMADYIRDTFVQLLEFKDWEVRNDEMLGSGRKVGFESITGEKSVKDVYIGYLPFVDAFRKSRYSSWGSDAVEQLKLRSPTHGIISISPDAVMTRYGWYAWSDWTGAGETVPIESPFEIKLNEYNRGKCHCEVIVTQDEDSQWWKVVSK